jgi:hypothetical protein
MFATPQNHLNQLVCVGNRKDYHFVKDKYKLIYTDDNSLKI